MRRLSITAVILCALVFRQISFSQSIFEPNKIGYTPAKQRLESFEKRKYQEEFSLVSNIPFKSIGPSVMSGRVVDIEVSPDDPTIFYVAYASGGIWKTTNNGTTFFPIFDDQPCMTIGDIAVDWKRNIVYAGTGENNSSRSSYAGTGIYKTTNDGKEWINIGLEETHRIGRVVISPENPDVIFVAALGHLYSSNAERGVYKSTDGGNNWKNVLFVNDVTGAIDLVMNSKNPGMILAAMWEKERRAWDFRESGKNSGVYRSTDDGETWTRMENCGLPDGDGFGRTGLAAGTEKPDCVYALIDNNNPVSVEKKKEEKITLDMLRTMTAENFLKLPEKDIESFLKTNDFPKEYDARYVIGKIKSGELKPVSLVEYLEDANNRLFNTDIHGAEVYRSDDFGLTWKKTHDMPLDGMFYTYGYYFANIRVSPFNSEKIYLLGVPLIKSDDGGKTFESIHGENVHADHHALWINPSRKGHLINGNDGGLNMSYDDGQTWTKLNSPSVGQFYSVNHDLSAPFNVYGGLQDNGVWYGPSNNIENFDWHNSGQYPFESVMGGDGMQVAVDTRDNDNIYTGYQFGNYYRISKSTMQYKYITPKHKLGERPYRFNWQSPIMLSSHNMDVVYLGSNKLHRSVNKGDSFETISGDLTNKGKIGNVAYGTLTAISESPLKEGLIYTGSDDGLVYVTKNGGSKWEKISTNLPQDLWVSRIIASAFDEGTVYVSLNGYRWDNFESYVYKSANYGKIWTRIGLNLPLEPVNVIKEDPIRKNVLFAGTDAGIYASIDGGNSFMVMKNLPNVPVHDLTIHPSQGILIAGTHGRSIYTADINYIRSLSPEVLSSRLHVFDIGQIEYSGGWGSRNFDWKYYIPEPARIDFFSNGIYDFRLEILLNDSIRVLDTALKSSAGLNFFRYDLTVGANFFEAYSGYIKNRYGKTLSASDNGKVYITEGKYTVRILGGDVFKTKVLDVARKKEPGNTENKGVPRPKD